MPEDAKPILVAVDFSSHSEHALAWALEAARRFEAPLVVLHVVHDPGYAPGSYRDKGADGPQLQEEVAQEMMDDFLRKFAEAHPGQCAPEDLPNGMCTKLAVGLPANRVVEVAEAEGAQRNPRYVRLEGLASEVPMLLQAVDHPSRVHLDIETDDIEAEVKRLVTLGAEVVERLERWTVMQAPSGHRFCVIGAARPGFDEQANVWA